MSSPLADRITLRALADAGNELALDRLADLANTENNLAELHSLLDEGSEHAGQLLTARAVAAKDLLELQTLADCGCEQAERELARLLAGSCC